MRTIISTRMKIDSMRLKSRPKCQMMSISMTLTNTIKVKGNSNLMRKINIVNNIHRNSSHKNSLIHSLKIRTSYNSLSPKSHVKMIIMNSFISNKDKDLKYNMRINMMILLIMTNDHCSWTQLPVTLKVKRKLKCKDLSPIKITKKLIS